jgi:hypothetical protein
MSWWVRCEAPATPQTPQDAIRELVRFARNLGVDVIGNVNGVDAFVLIHEFDGYLPGDRLWRLDKAAIERWEYMFNARGSR